MQIHVDGASKDQGVTVAVRELRRAYDKSKRERERTRRPENTDTIRLELATKLIDYLCEALDVNPKVPSDSLSEAGVECYRKWFGVEDDDANRE